MKRTINQTANKLLAEIEQNGGRIDGNISDNIILFLQELGD